MPTDDPRPAGVAGTRAITYVRLLYFFVFAAYGTTSIYRTLYYRRVGLSNGAIGALIATQSLVTIIAGPLWSALADRLNLRSRLLTLVIALSIVPMVATALCTQFWPLMLWNLLLAIMLAPVQPLMDSSAVHVLGSKRDRYGSIRAFGSLGYAPVAFLTGLFIEAHDLRWTFAAYGVLMMAAALISLRLEADETALNRNVLSGLGNVGRERAWLTMAAAMFVAMALQAVAFGYSALYLDTLGAPERLIGFSGALGAATEMVLMLTVLPWLVRHWGSERLLIFALGIYALRMAIWAFAPSAWAVALTEVTQGLSHGVSLVASVDFAARHAPKGLEVTSQSLLSTLVASLGRTAGGAVAGPLYDGIGPQALFTWFFGLASTAVLTFSLIWRRSGSTVKQPAPSHR